MTEEETEEVSLSRQDNTAIQRAAEIQPWVGFIYTFGIPFRLPVQF